MSTARKVAIVTGATSGIGSAVALEFARRGIIVVATGRNSERANGLLASMRATSPRSIAITADLRSASEPARIVSETIDQFGRVDILVNNAGVLFNGSVLDVSDAHWDETMLVNVTSVFRMSREVIRHMKAEKSGVIVNVASDWALVGAPNAVAYGTSKGALAQMTRCMALDHAKDGIRVNAVCPGDTETPMLDNAIAGMDRRDIIDTLQKAIPLGRIAKPEEIAKAIAFLASDDSSFMTGVLMPVDGGNSAQ